MKTYTITSPSLDGVLSDDHLYFEGINRPGEMYTVRDQKIYSHNSLDTLEKYFNDIYNLFLRKLSSFTMFEHSNEEESLKMLALLQELIKVKKLIEGSSVEEERDLV
ncbi:MAG: hypothetical protein Q7S72_00260 [Candidatus Taylorbacteria bacterium]|nr:hypothetical protein [Candidatus Taylorbacteria bacterium]